MLGTAVPLIITFAGLCLIFFLLRDQKYARRIALVAVLVTLLAAVDLSFGRGADAGNFLNFGPAELFGVYGAVLVLLLSLRYSLRSLVLAGIGAAVVTAMAVGYYWLGSDYGYYWLGSDWLNRHTDFIYILFAVLAFVLLVSIVIVSCGTARRVMAGESHASEKGESYASESLGWLDRILRALYTYERHSAAPKKGEAYANEKGDGVRGRVVFWTGSALVAALAYSMGNLQAVTLKSHRRTRILRAMV